MVVFNFSVVGVWTLLQDSAPTLPTQCHSRTLFLDMSGSIPQWLIGSLEFGGTNTIKRIFVSFL